MRHSCRTLEALFGYVPEPPVFWSHCPSGHTLWGPWFYFQVPLACSLQVEKITQVYFDLDLEKKSVKKNK